MRIELTRPLSLTTEQKQIMLLHGPLNLLNIIQGSLSLLTEPHSRPPSVTHQLAAATQFAKKLRSCSADTLDAALHYLEHLQQFIGQWPAEAATLYAACPPPEGGHACEMLTIAASRLTSALARLAPYLSASSNQASWRRYTKDEVIRGVRDFLLDLARHSRGRYGMQFDGLKGAANDYEVTIEVAGPDDTLLMPEIFWDTINDLLANARKYTAPGGALSFALLADAKLLTLKVGDTGRGIPPDEIERVVEFGYRAANAQDASSSVGGFGLTKAYYLCHAYHGTMTIASELGGGTCITLSIPMRAEGGL